MVRNRISQSGSCISLFSVCKLLYLPVRNRDIKVTASEIMQFHYRRRKEKESWFMI